MSNHPMDIVSPESQHGDSFVMVEPPDICVWKIVGHVSSRDVRRLLEIQRQFAKDKPFILVLLDLSAFKSVSLGARLLSVRGSEGIPTRGVAAFGASFHARVIVNLVMSAISVLSKQRDSTAAFFATEAEARQWIVHRRKVVLEEFAKSRQQS